MSRVGASRHRHPVYSVAPTCGVMLESVRFDFGKIRITVNGVTACWDLAQNPTC